MGDSFAYGWALDYEKTFAGMLESSQDKYFVNNLSVPSYSPTVYLYQIKKVQKEKVRPKKIFLALDLTDAMNEAHRWKKNFENQPQLFINIKKNISNWKNFRRENFKGTRLLSMTINSFIRKDGTLKHFEGGRQIKSLVPLIDVDRCFKYM